MSNEYEVYYDEETGKPVVVMDLNEKHPATVANQHFKVSKKDIVVAFGRKEKDFVMYGVPLKDANVVTCYVEKIN